MEKFERKGEPNTTCNFIIYQTALLAFPKKKKKKFKPTRKIRQHLDYHTQIMVKCVYQCLEPFWQYIRGIIGFIAVISVALVFVLITYFHRSFWPLLTIVYYLNSSFIDHAYCNHVCRVIQK